MLNQPIRPCFFFLLFFHPPQTERAYQKQEPIFENKKRLLGRRAKREDLRYTRNVGLGFKAPRFVRKKKEEQGKDKKRKERGREQ